MESLPVVSYGRVTDLANSYRQRIAGDICKTVPDNPLGVEERIGSILTGESDRLCTIESEEEEILAIMERWMRRSSFFSPEIDAMKEMGQKKVEVSRQQNLP